MEAKRGSVKPSVKEIKFAEDKMSATIEFNAVMIAGDYTVTVTGLTEEALTGTVKVEAEKLTKIEFLSDVAVQSEVMTGTTLDNINLKMNVQAKNQYDEIVNDKLRASSISITASKGASTGHEINKEGILTIKGNATDMFKVDDKVVVTIVDSETGVTATKTVTVVKSAQVDTIVLGELKTDDVELAKKPINVNNMGSEFAKYYIPVEIKDQYGNVLKAEELKDVNVLSSNDNIIRLAGTKIVNLAKVGTVIKFQAPKSPATHGTAVLTVVAAGTGKTANTTVKVLENAKTDVLTVSTPEKALKLEVKVELPFTAVDQYGNDLVSNTELVKDGVASGSKLLKFTDGSSITTTGATIDYSVDYGNKNKVKLHITPDAENVVITAVSATGKAQTLNLKAEKAPAAASLGGLSKDIYNLIQKGQTQTISLDDIVINDQYGEKINLPAGFSLKFEAEDGAADKVGITNTTLNNSTTSTVISAGVKGTEVFEISLIDNSSPAKTLDTITVTFETVELKDITTFGMKEVGKIFTGASTKYNNPTSDYAKNLTIFGKKGSAEVKVDQGLLVSATATAPIEVVGSAIPYKAIDTKGLDKTATLTGVVAGADNPLTITQTLTYSDAQSVVTDLKVRKTGNEAEIKDGAIVVPANFINGKKIGPVGATSTFQFYGEDQYGVAPREISYTVTNVAKADKSTAPTITISKAGEISVSGASLVEGDTFTITGIVDGVVKTIKVIVGDTVANTSLTASNIAIETPAKAIYNDGDSLDLSSLVVTVTYSNGVTEEIPYAQFVAKGIATDKANGVALTTADNGTEVVISVDGKSVNQAITVNPVFDSLTIKTAPTKTTYNDGETLELTGLEVDLLSKDGTLIKTVAFADFTAESITTVKANGTTLTTTDDKVVITKGSKTVNQAITVDPILVTGIAVTGAADATTIETNNGTLQMSAAVLPAGATNKAVTWSVVAGTGTASIDADGLLTALTNGTVTVKAVAKDGSLVEGTKEITISNQ
ncbi:Ig-like domain-containing protein [Tissierella creatinophila]|uniref:Bacterial Ig-like domain (Group 2) n=1 Tax=Tissierella creatinophila DSM 6911 TaxID=1123403 RepID=A0A1U7M5K8_TISCR|nr:Ig-like domain-containing protein [Tissierella creatinophila]OLS02597.1 bacterial Ig-like domain (group 2) [Tissierella creatinophila DSM 6911]